MNRCEPNQVKYKMEFEAQRSSEIHDITYILSLPFVLDSNITVKTAGIL